MNEFGLAAGLTLLYPTKIGVGFHAGIYILEKCKTTQEAIEALQRLPIGSAQTITLIDKWGNGAIVECNCDAVQVRELDRGVLFTTNHYITSKLQKYQYQGEDDVFSHERYRTFEKFILNEKSYSVEKIQSLLSGKYGFMCQYDRKKGMDTVWSCIYDLKENKIYRCEGNPARKAYKIERR